jgi:hypothetical protein
MPVTPAAQADEVLEGYGIHDCCCDHVVERLAAMPGPEEERRSVVRDRYYLCPHQWITPLEVYLGTLR